MQYLSIFFLFLSFVQPTFAEEQRLLEDFDEEYINEEVIEAEQSGKVIFDGKPIKIKDQLEERFKGSLFGVRYRNEVREAVNGSDINRLQYQVKLKLNIPISDNVKLKIEPQTGDNSWSSGWDDAASVDDNSQAEFAMTMRRMYLEGKLGEDTIWQVGSMPSRYKGSMSTPLNVDTDGWVSGARAVHQVNKGIINQVSATYGQIDFSDADFYDRSWDLDENEYAQIQVDGKVNDTIGFNTEFNRVHDEDYMRAQVNIDLKKLTGLMATYIIIEEVRSLDGNFDSLGQSVGVLKKDVNWRMQAAYVRNDQAPVVRRMTFGPTRPEGEQLFFFYERKLTDSGWVWALRYRHCIEEDVCSEDYRAEFIVRKRI
tara:strand:+ start:7246 stop:8355 length:1110 start_codon:yes stop_codon:yes gene_type:complete